ncbi:OmpA family protein [Sporocytophaga myxococcoides]|uniref:OmpA family protein n=1 Tax=Sporocytophaga myxococcoides TaxID=153721 RepID=UPI0003FC21E9|nr:OmpA family protein [Sporocytophaga myxococcoides]
MKSKIFFSFIFLLFFSLSASFGQNYSSTNKKAIGLFQEAEELVRLRKFNEAIRALQASIDKDPNFVEAHYKLGGIFKLLGNSEEGKQHFYKAAAILPNDKRFYFGYFTAAEFYFNDGDYESAKRYFQMMLDLKPNDKKITDEATQLLAKVEFGIKAKQNPLPFKPVIMSSKINRFYIHGYPVLTADQQTIIYYKKNGLTHNDDEDIVVSDKVNGEWSDPYSISTNINTKFNEGAASLSGDGKVLVFTSCNRQDGFGSCDLYVSYKIGDAWSEPVNLGANINSPTWESEPTISADGKTIYFSSLRRGGFGKEDIWYTKMDENGEWSPAKNLGKPVNTSGREVAPFIHANGKSLYFSSSYHLGMGGLDIFSSELTDSTWSEPANLGYPLNGPSNDATIFITCDSKKGFYTVYEKKDMRVSKAFLYEFDVPEQIQEKHKSTYSKGKIFDAVTKNPLGAKIELVDLKTGKVTQWVKSDSINGGYLIVLTEGSEYALHVSKPGYMFKSVHFDFNNPKVFDALALDVYLDPVKTGAAVVLNNIFFPSGSFALEEKSKTELDKISVFLKQNPKVNIEFGGHTDDVGADKDNLTLSTNRAKSVFDYLVKSGVTATRMKFKGYGETKPIQPNTSEENRQINRRIEFKIL